MSDILSMNLTAMDIQEMCLQASGKKGFLSFFPHKQLDFIKNK